MIKDLNELNTTEIRSLSEYVDFICRLQERFSTPAFYEKKIVYRGLSNSAYEVNPSIARLPEGNWVQPYLNFEKDLISLACVKCPQLISSQDTPITKLAKLQHYGIPTRLMDVTEDPLVALYFACKNANDKDGKVVVFRGYMNYPDNPYINMIADSFRLTGNFEVSLDVYLHRALMQDYAISLRYPDLDIKENIRGYSDFIFNYISRPRLVETAAISERQKNQRGSFIIFPNRIEKNDEEGIYEVFNDLKQIESEQESSGISIEEEIIIPGGIKDRLLVNLSAVGINQEFLFPDNIDDILKEVRKSQEDRYKTPAYNLFSD